MSLLQTSQFTFIIDRGSRSRKEAKSPMINAWSKWDSCRD